MLGPIIFLVNPGLSRVLVPFPLQTNLSEEFLLEKFRGAASQSTLFDCDIDWY